ncbi:hypothetical protein M1328_00750 [Patescibacteria group bacterium]|nr:hypothetical protein [Patescibacteria group bacterium]
MIEFLVLLALLYIAYLLSKISNKIATNNHIHKDIVTPNNISINELRDVRKQLNHLLDIVRGDRIAEFLKSKRMDELKKSYAKFLIKKDGLTEKNALIKANYIVDRYDEDIIAREIYEQSFDEYSKNTNEFEKSGMIEKDIKKAYVGNREMYEALWQAIRDGATYPGSHLPADLVEFESLHATNEYEEDKTYHQFIHRKAIIAKLLEKGFIKKTKETFGAMPKYELAITNLEHVKKELNIYDDIMSPSSGDENLEKQYKLGHLRKVFDVYEWRP